LLKLLNQIFGDKFYDQLRTKEQNGYLVWSGVSSTLNISSYRLIIQSARHSALYVDQRIEAFFDQFKVQWSSKYPPSPKTVEGVFNRGGGGGGWKIPEIFPIFLIFFSILCSQKNFFFTFPLGKFLKLCKIFFKKRVFSKIKKILKKIIF